MYTNKAKINKSKSVIKIPENSGVGSHLQLMDNRPEAIAQKKLQKIVNSYYATIQRQVLVNDKPASMLPGNSAFVNGEKIELKEQGAEWVKDGYTRAYNSNQEFKSHLSGEPVDVGLAKKLGRWYRLPFFSAKQFFVLGENHGAFGYRELIKESNQPGKVLGEGGANALLSATADNTLQVNPRGLKDAEGDSRESMMENVAAKAYFGLTVLRANCVKQKDGAGAGGAAAPVRLPEKEWLENYQNAAPEKRKVGSNLNKIPYYEDETGRKVYATFGSSAEHYNPVNTAFRVVADLDNAIQTYLLTNAASHGMTEIRAAIATATGIKNTDPVDYDALIAQIDILFPLVQTLAFAEARQMNGGNDPTAGLTERHNMVKANLPDYTPRQKVSFAHRDYVMYKSVLKARHDHVMAGMGDNHAKNLKDALTGDGIPVVLFNEFVAAPYSIDAIAPLKEKAGFDEKLGEAEADKEKFLIVMEANEKKGFETLLEVVTCMLEKRYVGAGNLYKEVLETLPKKDWSDRMNELDKVIDQISEYDKMDPASVGAGNLYIEFNAVLKKHNYHTPALI